MKNVNPVVYANKILAVLEGLDSEAKFASINIAEEILRYRRMTEPQKTFYSALDSVASFKPKWMRVKTKAKTK